MTGRRRKNVDNTEKLAELKRLLAEEAAAVLAVPPDGEYESADLHNQVSFDLIQSCKELADARVLHAALCQMQQELLAEYPKYFRVLSVIQHVLGGEAATRLELDVPYYRQANFLFFDVQIEHALHECSPPEAHATFVRLCGRKDKDVRSGIAYKIVNEGGIMERENGLPVPNMDAKIHVERLDGTRLYSEKVFA
jgi:hypothetical protein